MDPTAGRDAVRQLADDLTWLEGHCRRQPDLSSHAGKLRLAAALVRNVVSPAVEKQPPTPLFVAVVGGAGAGKSTVVNFLLGKAVADANPQAGYTRHPTAYIPAESSANWPSTAGFLGPLRRLSGEHPANLDEDVYQTRKVSLPAADDPLAGFVVWDCPDMTTWAAEGYVSRLLEVSALADVLVYVASDERYNDAVPTEFLQLLVRAGKAVIVTLTKMRPADAEALVDHFRSDVLTRIAPGDDTVPVVPVPHLTPAERADPARGGAAARVQLVNQLLVLCPTADAARRRTVTNALAFLEAAEDGLLEVARKDLSEIAAWKDTVAIGRTVFDERYRREYLAGEPFRRFDRTREQLLTLLELPSAARYLSAVFQLLRLPYFYLRELFARLVTRPPVPSLPEADVLAAGYAAWVEGLQAESLRRAGSHPIWKQIAAGFDASLRPQADEKFKASARQFELKESDELETAARGMTDTLTGNPTMLAGLRAGKAAADIFAVVLVVWLNWIPDWYHLLLVPLAAAVTHQVFEWVVRGWVDGVRRRARIQRETLLAEQLSVPLAAWLGEWPLAGGSAVERLQQVLARVPTLIRTAAAAVPQPPLTA